MSNLTAHDASAALQILADAAGRRRARLEKLNPASAPDSDDENDLSSPIFDAFYESGGSAAILRLTNFSSAEFMSLWNIVQVAVMTKWNVGRGRKSSHSAKDVLLMLLSVVKFGGKWDFLAQLFKIKTASFEKLVIGFLRVVAPMLYDTKVKDVGTSKWTSSSRKFRYFSYAKYVTDVTFQHANRLSGNHDEAKSYFSGKHPLYGYKYEVSVLPSGFSIAFTTHYEGSVSDIDILYKNIRFHRAMGGKVSEEKQWADGGDMEEEFPNYWAVLAGKGYQGSDEILRVIHPIKKPQGRMLTVEENNFNKAVSSDRIILENFFGRLSTLWGIVGNKYRWNESNYDILFGFCIDLTNFHISLHPLRNDEGENYKRYKLQLYSIGERIAQKRKQTQKAYRERRLQRLAVQFRPINGSDDESTQAPVVP